MKLILEHFRLKILRILAVKSGFKSVPAQLYFEIFGLASAKKWRKIQNMTEEERF